MIPHIRAERIFSSFYFYSLLYLFPSIKQANQPVSQNWIADVQKNIVDWNVKGKLSHYYLPKPALKKNDDKSVTPKKE